MAMANSEFRHDDGDVGWVLGFDRQEDGSKKQVAPAALSGSEHDESGSFWSRLGFSF
jgi:hypothetical protein